MRVILSDPALTVRAVQAEWVNVMTLLNGCWNGTPMKAMLEAQTKQGLL